MISPILHGLMDLGLGLVAHELAGFSAGGIVLLAVMAASSSDISGPPTIRCALPDANPSGYVGTSTGIGTPVAIPSIPLWSALAEKFVGLSQNRPVDVPSSVHPQAIAVSRDDGSTPYRRALRPRRRVLVVLSWPATLLSKASWSALPSNAQSRLSRYSTSTPAAKLLSLRSTPEKSSVP